mmetsp:Transcript_9305/g.19476  ORF Transcript_9305/g.19476 Transcript_9305/m.19476 type:complete len:85 (+) Transcript_9305:664-918(+)
MDEGTNGFIVLKQRQHHTFRNRHSIRNPTKEDNDLDGAAAHKRNRPGWSIMVSSCNVFKGNNSTCKHDSETQRPVFFMLAWNRL